jgi:hypothetical protein
MELKIKRMEDLERSGENGLGQEGLKRCGCRPMLPGGQKVKKKNQCTNHLIGHTDNLCPTTL